MAKAYKLKTSAGEIMVTVPELSGLIRRLRYNRAMLAQGSIALTPEFVEQYRFLAESNSDPRARAYYLAGLSSFRPAETILEIIDEAICNCRAHRDHILNGGEDVGA